MSKYRSPGASPTGFIGHDRVDFGVDFVPRQYHGLEAPAHAALVSAEYECMQTDDLIQHI
jgi:hypothetical protein